MIEGILLTDMALHGKVFASAKDLVARNAAAIAHAQHSAAAAAAAVPGALIAALHSSTNNNTTATATTETSVRSSSDVTGDVSGDVAATALTLSPEDERAMLACLLHAADLSSPGRPWTVSKQWVDRLWEVCAVLLLHY
jgi:3'5'-cyclic nucleotide phosphodiesterase